MSDTGICNTVNPNYFCPNCSQNTKEDFISANGWNFQTAYRYLLIDDFRANVLSPACKNNDRQEFPGCSLKPMPETLVVSSIKRWQEGLPACFHVIIKVLPGVRFAQGQEAV
jgi:hypothetical protein